MIMASGRSVMRAARVFRTYGRLYVHLTGFLIVCLRDN